MPDFSEISSNSNPGALVSPSSEDFAEQGSETIVEGGGPPGGDPLPVDPHPRPDSFSVTDTSQGDASIFSDATVVFDFEDEVITALDTPLHSTTAGELERAATLFAEPTASSSNQELSADVIAARFDELEAEWFSNEDNSISVEGERVLREIFARARQDLETSDDPAQVIAGFESRFSIWAATEELVAYEGVLLEEARFWRRNGLPAHLMEQLGSILEDSAQLTQHQERIDLVNEYIDATEPYASTIMRYGHLLEGLDPELQSQYQIRESHPFLIESLSEALSAFENDYNTRRRVEDSFIGLVRQLARVNQPLTTDDLQHLPELIEELHAPHFAPNYPWMSDTATLDYLENVFNIEEAKDLRERWDSAPENLDLMFEVRSLTAAIGQYREGQNDGGTLLATLRILELWGTGNDLRQRELLRYDAQLTQALEKGDRETVDTLVSEITAWFPGYMQNVYRPYDDSELATGGLQSGTLNRYIDSLAVRDPESVSVDSVARFGMFIALAPHSVESIVRDRGGNTSGAEASNNLVIDRIDLAQASLIYNRIARSQMVQHLDQAYEERYGPDGLANGLPPQNEDHGDHSLALTTYFSRPVAEAYQEFSTRDASDWEATVTDFQRLAAMAQITDHMNTIWDVREIVGQYDDPHVFIDWDEVFLSDEALGRLRAFGEESYSRLNTYEDALTILADADTPAERNAALEEAAAWRATAEERFGTELAYFDDLLGNEDSLGMVRTILEMNEGRDGMVNLIETAVLTVVTFGTIGIASRISSSITRGWRAAEGLEAGTELTGFRGFLSATRGVDAAGQATRWGRLVSATEMGGLFNTSRMILHPEEYVTLDSTTWQDAGRIAFSYAEWIGTFGVFETIAMPFQRLASTITQMRRAAPGLFQRIGLGVAEAGVVTLEIGAELVGEVGEELTFNWFRNLISPLLGDEPISSGEMLHSLFSERGLRDLVTQMVFMRGGHMMVRDHSSQQSPEPPVPPETLQASNPSERDIDINAAPAIDAAETAHDQAVESEEVIEGDPVAPEQEVDVVSMFSYVLDGAGLSADGLSPERLAEASLLVQGRERSSEPLSPHEQHNVALQLLLQNGWSSSEVETLFGEARTREILGMQSDADLYIHGLTIEPMGPGQFTLSATRNGESIGNFQYQIESDGGIRVIGAATFNGHYRNGVFTSLFNLATFDAPYVITKVANAETDAALRTAMEEGSSLEEAFLATPLGRARTQAGFVGHDVTYIDRGNGIFHVTSHRTPIVQPVAVPAVASMAGPDILPADALMAEGARVLTEGTGVTAVTGVERVDARRSVEDRPVEARAEEMAESTNPAGTSAPEHLQQSDFHANDLIAYHRSPEREATLEDFRDDPGSWGIDARQFERGLERLEDLMTDYNELQARYDETNDPAEEMEMARLLSEEILPATNSLEQSWYHQMNRSYEDAVQRFRSEFADLGMVLASTVTHSGLGTNGFGNGELPIDYEINLSPPELLSRHVPDFDLVPIEELFSMDVVASPEQAQRVMEVITENGMEIAHNSDLHDMTGALTGKDVTVRLPSGLEATVNIQIREAVPAESVAEVAVAAVAGSGVPSAVVAGADLMSNRSAVLEAGYLQSLDLLNLREIPADRRATIDRQVSEFNPLTDNFESVSTSLPSSAEARYFELALYRSLGGRSDNLSTTLRRQSTGREGGDNSTRQASAINEALTRQLRQIEGISTRLSQKLEELGLRVDEQAQWSIIQELLQNQVPGLGARDLWNRVAGQIRRPRGTRGQPFTLEMFQTALHEGVDRVADSQVPRVDLTPELFEGSDTPSFEVDRVVVDQVVQDAARAEASGHTLDDAYLHRHITPETLEFVRDNPSVEVRIYDGPPGRALHDLQQNGFTEVSRLSDNRLTDFHKYIARNPSTGETSLVMIAPQGRAYAREIASHFLYGDYAISPSRIRVLRSPGTAQAEFATTLGRINVDPDVLMIGNVDQFRDLMRDRGIEPVREINEPNLYGFVYEVNGETVLSVGVEPHLYADRAGEFVRAVLGQSSRTRSIFFTGTAGSLRAGIGVGDLVVPSTFSDANGLEPVAVGGVHNDAIALTQEAGLQRPGVFTEGSLGAVDTIMAEDRAWFDSHTRGDTRLDIVEQEGAGIAQAIAEHRAANGEEASVDFHAVYRISDNLVTGEDFAGNEFNRPEPRSGLTQEDFFSAMLDRTFGSDLQATPTETQVPTVLTQRRGRFQITPEGAGSPRLNLQIENFETFNLVDQGAAQSLLSEANRIVAGLRVSEGRVVNQAEIQRALANLALEYQGQFGIRVRFSLEGGTAQPQGQSAASGQ